ncbi:Hypothetical predicted protein [Octopus vulgaris]|uniref:Uncharacterized protein n=1 Tax=Octopus vulgaris TaxID=6645 RepID=A0AA36EYM2_OCTVU|nr:Hypothetical predicted protein [Octopus vulgaris]
MEKTEMKSYAETAGMQETENSRMLKQENMEWDVKKLRKYSRMVQKEETNIKLIMPEDEKRKFMNKTILFRTFSNENRRMGKAPQEEIEELLLESISEEIQEEGNMGQ